VHAASESPATKPSALDRHPELAITPGQSRAIRSFTMHPLPGSTRWHIGLIRIWL
jgi:hypothetical protein